MKTYRLVIKRIILFFHLIAPGVVWSQCTPLNINPGGDTVICPDGTLYPDARGNDCPLFSRRSRDAGLTRQRCLHQSQVSYGVYILSGLTLQKQVYSPINLYIINITTL